MVIKSASEIWAMHCGLVHNVRCASNQEQVCIPSLRTRSPPPSAGITQGLRSLHPHTRQTPGRSTIDWRRLRAAVSDDLDFFAAFTFGLASLPPRISDQGSAD